MFSSSLLRLLTALVLLLGVMGAIGHGVRAESAGGSTTATRQRMATITTGGDFSCAILSGGSVKCWGGNQYGQLGLGDTNSRGDAPGEMGDNLPAVDLGAGRTATALSAGRAHVCALLDNGSVKCWGRNNHGQLGQGDTNDRGDGAGEMGANLPAIDLGTGRTAVAITAGGNTFTGNFSCAILDNGSVKCWGGNAFGQLGQGDTADRGDGANEMGNNLPAIVLGLGATAISIAAGNHHVCVILNSGNVKCWGYNTAGQLGQGDTNARGDGANEMDINLLFVHLGTGRTATAITAGGAHTCVILDTGNVACWGDNAVGKLGIGNTNDRGDGANEMGANLQLADVGTGRTAVAIASGSGSEHTCAVLDNGSLKCWGFNNPGQLGLGDIQHRGDNSGEMGDNLPAVALGAGRTALAVATGELHTCAMLDDLSMKCWGFNGTGQLGQGDTSSRGDAANEMGDNLLPVVVAASAPTTTSTTTTTTIATPTQAVVVAPSTTITAVTSTTVASVAGTTATTAIDGEMLDSDQASFGLGSMPRVGWALQWWGTVAFILGFAGLVVLQAKRGRASTR